MLQIMQNDSSAAFYVIIKRNVNYSISNYVTLYTLNGNSRLIDQSNGRLFMNQRLSQ